MGETLQAQICGPSLVCGPWCMCVHTCGCTLACVCLGLVCQILSLF